MKPELSDYQQRFVDRIRAMPVVESPRGWRAVGKIGVGGLQAVGFSEDSDLLLIVSSAGRGLIECTRGERVARDYDSSGDWLHLANLTADGIGPISEQKVAIAGVFGGGLHLVTDDGWSVDCVWPDWPDGEVILNAPGSGIYQDDRALGCTKIGKVEELRAYGFSQDEAVLVVALSHTLMIWRRDSG